MLNRMYWYLLSFIGRVQLIVYELMVIARSACTGVACFVRTGFISVRRASKNVFSWARYLKGQRSALCSEWLLATLGVSASYSGEWSSCLLNKDMLGFDIPGNFLCRYRELSIYLYSKGLRHLLNTIL